MTDPYWIDDDQGSTIQFSKTESDGTTTTIHMSVVKSDRLEQNTPVRQNNTITQNVTDNISAYVSVTPIVTYDAENAFAFDTSANEQVSFDFIRKNPQGTYYKLVDDELVETPLPDDTNLDDDRVWSNRHWIEQFSALINRWQALTDGCVMSYVPLDDTLQYAYSVNVFLRNLSYTLSINSNEVITGTVDVQIGSMTANAARAQDSDVEIKGYNELITLPDPKLSTLRITKDYGILLPDYNDMEITLPTLSKVVYFFFLRHPKGLRFKELVDYREELLQIYYRVSNRDDSAKMEQSIDDLVDSTRNSINEKCSRIRAAFVTRFSDDLAKNYYITGLSGEAKYIPIDRSLVMDEAGILTTKQ